MRIVKQIIHEEKSLPWVAFYMKEPDKILRDTKIYKAANELEKLRWDLDWACHKRGLRG